MIHQKKFKLFDSVLMAVIVILVVESAAPAAAIGASQFFWWIALFIFFFIPYGLVSAELGSTYEGEGGIFDWAHRAFGYKMSTRVGWYYWINFPLWMASLAVLFSKTIVDVWAPDLPAPVLILLEIGFLFVITVLGNLRVSKSKWILNGCALLKAFIMVCLGALGIYGAVTHGVANEYTVRTMLPNLNINSISFLSVIIFNFLGFEVVTTVVDDMPNPKRQIPRAIILGGLLIILFYTLAALGIGIAIPTDELSLDSGFLESFNLLLGDGAQGFYYLMAVFFLLTLFGNLISWSPGINFTAAYAAAHKSLPKFFAKKDKNGMPVGAAIANLAVAGVLCIISHFLPNEDIFWNFFALNMITLLISYVLIFPAFLRLRITDANVVRPFRVPGGEIFTILIAFVPMVLLIMSILFSVIPFSLDSDELSNKLPILAGTAVAIIIGEILVLYGSEKYKL
jgi:amino acid transporter